MNFTNLASHQSNIFCNLLELDGYKILLDCGWDESFDLINLQALKRIAPTLSCIVISHASIYHMGALPYIFDDLPENTMIYCTEPVQLLTRYILEEAVICNGWDSNCVVSVSTATQSEPSPRTSTTTRPSNPPISLTYKNLISTSQPETQTFESQSSFNMMDDVDMVARPTAQQQQQIQSRLLNSLPTLQRPIITPRPDTYTSHPYNLDTIHRLMDRIQTITFKQTIPLRSTQHQMTLSCSSAGHTLGAAIWYFLKDDDVITYLANTNHTQDTLVDRFSLTIPFTGHHRLMIVGNKSYDMRTYANLMTRWQWKAFLRMKPEHFNNGQNTRIALQRHQQGISLGQIGRGVSDEDAPTLFQQGLQANYGKLDLLTRDQRQAVFVQEVDSILDSGKASIFLPVQETARILEILSMLLLFRSSPDSLSGQNRAAGATKRTKQSVQFKHNVPIVFVGHRANVIIQNLKTTLATYVKQHGDRFDGIITATDYKQAKNLVKEFYSHTTQSRASAIYVSAVETSLHNGPTADLFREFLPSSEDHIILTEVPFLAFDPYFKVASKIPYKGSSLLSYLYHFSTNTCLSYTTPDKYATVIPGINDENALADSPSIMEKKKGVDSAQLGTPHEQLFNGVTIGATGDYDFKLPSVPRTDKGRSIELESLTFSSLTPKEQFLLQAAWESSLQLDYFQKKRSFMFKARQEAKNRKFLSENYGVDEHLFGVDYDNDDFDDIESANSDHNAISERLASKLLQLSGVNVGTYDESGNVVSLLALQEQKIDPKNTGAPTVTAKLTRKADGGNGPLEGQNDPEEYDLRHKRFKSSSTSTLLELFPALESDTYVQLENQYNAEDAVSLGGKLGSSTRGFLGFNATNPGPSQLDIRSVTTALVEGINLDTAGGAGLIGEPADIQFLTLSSNNPSLGSTHNQKKKFSFDDLNKQPHKLISDVYGLSLNLDSLLMVAEERRDVELSMILKEYQSSKAALEKTSLAYFENEQQQELQRSCPEMKKVEKSTLTVPFNCKITTVPLTIYTDMQDLAQYISKIPNNKPPQNIFITKGQGNCRLIFQGILHSQLQLALHKIALPQPHNPFFLQQDTHTKKFIIDEDLLRSIKLSAITDSISFAPIVAQIVLPQFSSEYNRYGPHGKKEKEISTSTNAAALHQLPLLTVPQNIDSVNQNNSTMTNAVFLGNKITLNTIKDKLQEYNIPADLTHGWLICGSRGQCTIKKTNETFSINGALCEDTIRIREILYDQFKVLF